MFGSTNTTSQSNNSQAAYIVTTYPQGSSCQATRTIDGTLLKAKSTDGNWNFSLPEIIDDVLPDEYQLLKYINIPAGAYINTGINASSNIYTEMKIYNTTFVSETPYFGTSNYTNSYYHVTEYNNKYYYGNGSGENEGGTWTPGIKLIQYNNLSEEYLFKINGNVLTALSNQPLTNDTIYLFKRAHRISFNGRLYYCFMINNTTGNYVRKMYPCYHKTTGEVGLYDMISNSFFVNNGSSFLTAGPIDGEEWVVSCTDNEQTASKTVYVSDGTVAETELKYDYYFIKDGVLLNESLTTNISSDKRYYDNTTGSYVINGNGQTMYAYFPNNNIHKYTKMVFHIFAMGGYFNNKCPQIGISTGVPTSFSENSTPEGTIAYLKMGDATYSQWLGENTYEVNYTTSSDSCYAYLWASYVSNTSGKPAWTSAVGVPYFYILDWYLTN